MRAPSIALAGAAALLLGTTSCSSSGGQEATPMAPTFTVTDLGTPVAGWEDAIHAYRITSPVTGIADRRVRVILPPGYVDPANASRRYPVLYMNDGQNGIDWDAFGHGGWQLHTATRDLAQAGRMAPVVVVLVDVDTAHRTEEFFPGAGAAPGPTTDGYLDLLALVVDWVDGHHRTIADPAHRAIGGSSYGGLVSLYAGWKRPALFGRVMALSPILLRDGGAVSCDLEALLTTKVPSRVYLDSGTVMGAGDDGAARTEGLRDLLVSRGYALHGDLEHVKAVGHEHNELYWHARLLPSTETDLPNVWPGALVFTFPPGGP